MRDGKGQGLWPDMERRRLMAEFRAQGLRLAQISWRLGITKQAVHRYLTRPLRSAQPGVTCRGCGGVAVPAGAPIRERGEGLCPACLRRRGGVVVSALALGADRRAHQDQHGGPATSDDGMQGYEPAGNGRCLPSD